MIDNNTIKDGDTVIFDVNGGDSKVKLGGKYCSVAPLIGSPFGSFFTLSKDGSSIERIQHTPSEEWGTEQIIAGDNSKLEDSNTANQKLTAEDIVELKSSGTSGREIVEALTQNSLTYESKTVFSQQKYRKKKAKKYVVVACARRPSAAIVCSAYFSKTPARISYIRPDSLALLLHLANVGPGTRALVMESSGGLVTGAVAERLGGLGGIVCSTFLGTKPPSLEITKAFNFEEKIKASIIRKPLSKLLESLRRAKQTCNEKESQLTKHEMQVDKNDGLEPTLELVPVPVNESVQAVTNDDVDGCQGHHDHGDNDDSPFSSCIVVMSTVEPKSAFFTLLPLLAPSSSFAILSPIMQSLAECMHALRTRECAVGMALQEVWFREQQMLPKRTHPMMNMNHGGGYLLSGTVTLSGSQLPIATACGNK